MQTLLTNQNTVEAEKNDPSGDFIAVERVSTTGVIGIVIDMPGSPTPAEHSKVQRAWEAAAHACAETWEDPPTSLVARALTQMNQTLRDARLQCSASLFIIQDQLLALGALGDTTVTVHRPSPSASIHFTLWSGSRAKPPQSDQVIYPPNAAGMSDRDRLGTLAGSYPEAAVETLSLQGFPHLLLYSDGLLEVLPDFTYASGLCATVEAFHKLVSERTPSRSDALKDDVSFAVLSLAELTRAPVHRAAPQPPVAASSTAIAMAETPMPTAEAPTARKLEPPSEVAQDIATFSWRERIALLAQAIIIALLVLIYQNTNRLIEKANAPQPIPRAEPELKKPEPGKIKNSSG